MYVTSCVLQCDGCNREYHMDCLKPPLGELPIDAWICKACVKRHKRQAKSAEKKAKDALIVAATPAGSAEKKPKV